MMPPIQFNDSITPISQETMIEIADALYDLQQAETGKRLHACATWKGRNSEEVYLDDDSLSSPMKTIAAHTNIYPVHPLCIRRAYYVLRLELKDNPSHFTLVELDPSVGDTVVADGSIDLNDLRQGKPANVNYKSFVGEDNLPLDIARPGIILDEDYLTTKGHPTPDETTTLYVQSWYQILREVDWAHLDKDIYLAEDYDEPDGLHYMETVFPIGRWIGKSMEKDRKCSVYHYHEVTRYPQY